MAYRKPSDYDSVRVGDYKVLPAGGYICRILKAEETTSSTGKPMLKIAFDIADGDFTGYFMNLFNERKTYADDPKDVKWPFNGTKWILFTDNEGKTNRDFKSFCTALEDSGTEVWNNDVLNVAAMKDALVGIVFRREEHEWNNVTNWRTTPWRFRSVPSIENGSYTVPEDKPLVKAAELENIDSFSAAEDDIPF